jgi:hypothetical protein
MRRGALLGVASLMALGLIACSDQSPAASGSSSPVPTISVTPNAATATSPTVKAVVASTPVSSALVKDIVLVKTLGIDASFTETSCADLSLLTVVPAGATILYADCGGYWRFVASDSGPLAALLSAPAGTAFEWVNGAGVHVVKVLNGSVVTVARDTGTGQFPGHGVAPGSTFAFIQLRNGSQQTELTAR